MVDLEADGGDLAQEVLHFAQVWLLFLQLPKMNHANKAPFI